MNELKLTRMGHNLSNRTKDQRMTLSSTVSKHLEQLNDEEKNQFLLKSLPYIRDYYEKMKTNIGVPTTTTPPPVHLSAAQNANQTTPQQPRDISSFVGEYIVTERGRLYKQFMKECMDVIEDEEEGSSRQFEYDCEQCHVPMTYLISDAALVCEKCGVSLPYQDFGLALYVNSPSFSGEVMTAFPYKRQNHMKEWLTQIQGKENTSIPDTVIIQIMKELKKERIQDERDITQERIKRYLKKNGLSKYYEHVPTIINKICRRGRINIPYELECELINKFSEIQEPFERHRPTNRKNFLSYSYTLHKLCEILGHKELAVLFPLLKSRSKLRAQDEIWEKICRDKQWMYIPSV